MVPQKSLTFYFQGVWRGEEDIEDGFPWQHFVFAIPAGANGNGAFGNASKAYRKCQMGMPQKPIESDESG